MNDESLYEVFVSELEQCQQIHQVFQLKARFLGRKSKIIEGLKLLKDLPLEQRKQESKRLNELRESIEKKVAQRVDFIKNAELEAKLSSTSIDLSMLISADTGSIHPIIQTIHEMQSIFEKMGFSVRRGPDIETEHYNFDALNVPKNHPARAMQDTFYFSPKHVLRTHTSSVQIRVLEKESPPLRIITPGRVYRSDDIDPTHSPMFHQLEGLVVDKKTSFADLKATLKSFIHHFFGSEVQTQFRPNYFPFTEPSAELDVFYNGSWMEVLGCGMVHPQVLRNVGLNPDVYQGFAFGMGVDRFAMMKFGIDDLRMFFENDPSFLQQF